MKTAQIMAAAVLVATGLKLTVAQADEAQLGGVERTELLRHDLSISGREVIQVLVAFAPGVMAPRRSHPGEEIVYIVEGSLEYALQGKPPVTLKAGDTLFIPHGAIHAVKNVGSGNAAELATRISSKKKSRS